MLFFQVDRHPRAIVHSRQGRRPWTGHPLRWAACTCLIGATAGGQQAPPPAGGGTIPPPTITFSNTATTDTLFPYPETIRICSATLIASKSATFNGVAITNFVSDTGATQCVKSTATYTTVVGTNTFTVNACSTPQSGNQGSCGGTSFLVVHPALAVQPKGAVTSVAGGVNVSQTFTISNYQATSQTYALALSCGGRAIAACPTTTGVTVPAGSSMAKTYTFVSNDTIGTSGTLQLKATVGSFADSAVATFNVTGHFVVSTKYTNQEDQDYSRCATGCFALTTSLGTAPSISRDVPRGVTLVYNSDAVAMRPVIVADVTVNSPLDTVQTFELRALVHGTWATFSNGETVLRFKGSPANHSTKPFRLTGVILPDTVARSESGAYELKIVVTADYATHQEQLIDTTHALAVVNGRTSRIARGWSISGVPSLHSYYHANGSINQLKYLLPTGDGSSITYTTANGCIPVCVPVLPAGVFSTIAPHDSADGAFEGQGHVYIDSSFEVYDLAGNTASNAPNAGGQLTYAVSRTLADTIRYTYDSIGPDARVRTMSDPHRLYRGAHAVTTLHYDNRGHLARIVEAAANGAPDSGRVWTVTVDTSGLLTAWMDPDSGVTRFGYDAQQRLTSTTDRNLNVTTYTYEPVAWKLASVTSPLVPIDANANGSTSMRSLVTTLGAWQVIGVPTTATSVTPATPVEADTVEGVMIDPAGAMTRFTVDQWGQPLVTHTPLGVKTTYTRDANGFPLTFMHPDGVVDQYVYSGPNVVSAQPAAQFFATQYQYDAFNQLAKISGEFESTQTFARSKRGHVDSTQVNGHTTVRYFADGLGRDTAAVDTLGGKTRYVYDASSGNLATVVEALGGRRTTKTFDPRGRPTVVAVSSATGSATVTTTAYDSLNRVVTVLDGVHATPTTYAYDGLYVTHVTDPKGQVYTTTHNAIGWTLTQTDPTNRAETTTYNARGSAATVRNRRGQLLTFGYDSLGRVLQIKRPAVITGEPDAVESWSYSPDGDTTIASNGVSTDASYRNPISGLPDSTVTTLNGSATISRVYLYDLSGRLLKLSIATRNVSGFDFYTRAYFWSKITGQLDSTVLTSPAGVRNTVSMHYDARFMPDTISYPGGVRRANTYTDTRQLQSETWSGLNQVVYRGYGYDSTGRVQEQDYGKSTGNVEFFGYDAIGELTSRQLAQWNDTLLSCPNNSFTGNGCGLQRQFHVAQQQGYTFDLAGSLSHATVGSTDTAASFLAGNRLQAWGSTTFAGDSDGNRTSTTASATTQYIWGADGRLLQVIAGSTTRTYDYNALGQLVRRSTNGTADRYYLWDAGQLIGIMNPGTTARIAEFAYSPGTDKPLARIKGAPGSTTVHYYVQDGAGNVIAQFSGTTIEQVLAYEPWGAMSVSTPSGGDTTQLRWKSLLFEDGTTPLYYDRARWYDPNTRRFISPDPVSGGGNQFAFAGGDPVNRGDPSGAISDYCGEDVDVECTVIGDGSGEGGAPTAADTTKPADCTQSGTCGDQSTAVESSPEVPHTYVACAGAVAGLAGASLETLAIGATFVTVGWEVGLAAGVVATGAEIIGIGEARGGTALVTGVINKYGAGVAAYFFGQATKVNSVARGTPLISAKELGKSLIPIVNVIAAGKDVKESCF